VIRPVIISTAILCSLFGAADAGPKSPNIPNTIVVPRPPSAGRILVVPRKTIVPLADQAEDNTKKRKKIIKKRNVTDGLRESPKSRRVSAKGLPVSDGLRDVFLVFGGNSNAIAELKEILEGVEDGDNGAFGGPLAALFPGHQAPDPKPNIPGTGGHTTGQHQGTGNPGDQLEDIVAGFVEAGNSGDNRGPDEGQSGSDDPYKITGNDRTSSVGGMGIGAFGGGVSDPSGQASQDGWVSCGSGCRARVRTIERGGRVVGIRSERRDQSGTTTSTTNTRTGTTETRFRSDHWAYPSYRSVSHTSPDNQQKIETRDYISPRMDDVIITYVVGEDGGWTESSRTPIPEVDQPAPDGAPTGNGPRGGAFYRLVCGGMVCTYSPLSREQVAVGFGPIQINPGDVGNEGSGDADTGPRVGPRAVTDPDPENLGLGSGGGRPPVERGCGGLVHC
jgi:hypothetical protein